jgi:thiol-disulfide isomerase/thioredoxin
MKLCFSKIAIIFISSLLLSCGGGDDDSFPEENNPDTPLTTSKFTKKVLIEDFTGTWCGWCPRVSFGIEKVEEETNQAITVAIHRGSTDPYHFGESNIGSLDDGSYPTAKLNRNTLWNYPEPDNVAQILHLTNEVARLGLSINSSLNNNSISVEVKTTFETNLSELKQVVYLVEDHLNYDQANYTDYYNGVSTISNFEHNNVLRKVLTNIYGDSISSTDSKKDNEYTVDYDITIPTSVANATNLKIVAFIVDTNGNVLNVQSAKINQFKDYD